jgi:pimeloyl-ACP methyl ester carboxylesterase
LIFVLLATVLGVLIGLSYRSDIRAARVRVSSGSQVVNTPCGLIEYADVGHGLPVLVVHGAAGGFDQGLDIGQPFFVERSFRVIAVSRFGYLRTCLPADGSPTAQADAHACLLDALKIERVGVFGVSAGAPSAMQLCLRHPERCWALILLSPATFAPPSAGETQPKRPRFLLFLMNATLHSDFLFWTATKLPRDMLLKTFLGTPPNDFRAVTAAEQAGALQAVRHLLPIRQRAKGMQNDLTIVSSLPRYDLERIRVPTLLISAEDDLYGTFRGARYAAEHIPGARFLGFPTGGHLLMGHGNEATAEMAEFLRLHGATSLH